MSEVDCSLYIIEFVYSYGSRILSTHGVEPVHKVMEKHIETIHDFEHDTHSELFKKLQNALSTLTEDVICKLDPITLYKISEFDLHRVHSNFKYVLSLLPLDEKPYSIFEPRDSRRNPFRVPIQRIVARLETFHAFVKAIDDNNESYQKYYNAIRRELLELHRVVASNVADSSSKFLSPILERMEHHYHEAVTRIEDVPEKMHTFGTSNITLRDNLLAETFRQYFIEVATTPRDTPGLNIMIAIRNSIWDFHLDAQKCPDIPITMWDDCREKILSGMKAMYGMKKRELAHLKCNNRRFHDLIESAERDLTLPDPIPIKQIRAFDRNGLVRGKLNLRAVYENLVETQKTLNQQPLHQEPLDKNSLRIDIIGISIEFFKNSVETIDRVLRVRRHNTRNDSLNTVFRNFRNALFNMEQQLIENKSVPIDTDLVFYTLLWQFGMPTTALYSVMEELRDAINNHIQAV